MKLHDSARSPFALVVLAMVSSACATELRTIPMANPANEEPSSELRIKNPDERLREDCDKQGATDCLDAFFRLERVEPERVVFRYRLLSPTAEGAHLESKYVDRVVFTNPEGQSAIGKLSDEFVLERLPSIDYADDGYVETGRTVYRAQGDGSVVSQKETTIGQVTRKLERYSGSNYVVFEGKDLIGPNTQWVTLDFPGGLLGGGAKWTFKFGDAAPENAVMANEREPASPAK
ncbi:MAG: hypothetical protein HOW73_41510 [Polyangiaceae bacterium]|nr:hypothetical protein [Polyangiaceae bacterium]